MQAGVQKSAQMLGPGLRRDDTSPCLASTTDCCGTQIYNAKGLRWRHGGQSNFQFLASFSGRPQQRGFFFAEKNTRNVSDPSGLMVGGMISSTVLTLAVIPAIYGMVKQWELGRVGRGS